MTVTGKVQFLEGPWQWPGRSSFQKDHDSDREVNIIFRRTMTVTGKLIQCFYYTWYIHYVNIGPKAPGAHRAHGPRPLGPMGAQLGGWGKLPTVRQSYLYCQACTQQPHTCTQPSHRHAPKSRIHAPKSIHRLAPNNCILCTQPSHRHAPKRHRLCTQK